MNEASSGRLLILVADDDPQVLASYRLALGDSSASPAADRDFLALQAELYGDAAPAQTTTFDLALCRQGEEAVQAVRAAQAEGRPFVAAFLDVRMPPGPDGVVVAETLRGLDPDIQIVIATAYTDVHPRDIARRVPPADKLFYIQKPFHAQEIQQFAVALGARWHAERGLAQAHRVLEDRVAQRTAELLKANEALTQEVAAHERAEQELRASQTYLAALHETALALMNRLELSSVLEAIIAQAARLLGTAHGFIYLREPEKGYVELKVGIGVYVDYVGYRLTPGEGLAGKVWHTGQPLVVDDYATWPGRSAQYPIGMINAALGVPLLSGAQVVGVIGLAHIEPGRTFSAEEAGRLRQFAELASIALDNARLHDEIRRHAAELELRVAERTAELRAANERLKELDQLKSRFVSNVSHELRTPLANIKTLLYLLEKGKPEKRSYYMATLGRETDLLQQIIEDLLQLSRFDQDKTQLELAAVDVNDLIGTLAADRTTLFASRGLGLTVELAPGLLMALADGRMLVQVATNLMTNAMYYTPAGGTVTVRTRLQQGGQGAGGPGSREDTEHVTPDTWVTFSIGDTGPGITPGDRAHLFERFYRGEAGRQNKAPGTGLGLAICREIVERHGGRITLETGAGQGSTFTVWLPALTKDEG